MKVTVDISCCQECPHCVTEIFDDVGYGWDRDRCKNNGDKDIPNKFLIPDWCPVLKEQKGLQ